MPIARPSVTATLRSAGVTAGLTPEKLLFIGQKHFSGTAAGGALVPNIGTAGEEDALFGANTPLAAAIRRARERNGVTQFDAIGLTDAGASNATGTMTVSGTATASGALTVIVGSEKRNAYTVSIASGDNSAAVAVKIGNAVTGALVAPAVVLSVVTFTANNTGTVGNTIGLAVDGAVAGISVAVVGMTGGATDPTLTNVFDVIGSTRYQGIVWQFDKQLSTLTDFLDARFNVTNDIQDGVGFVGITDTYASHLTTLGALNSRSLSINVDKTVSRTNYQGPAVMELPFVKAAEFAAIRALRRTDEAALGNLVISRTTRDAFGGPHQNSKPYFNTPFAGMLPPETGDAFTAVEVTQLQAAGGWVADANRAGTAVIAGEVVTTYKTDSAGNPDPTFGFLNYVDTASAAREYIVNNTRSQYPQYRATGGALIAGVDSANEASVATFVAGLNADLGDLALVNTGVGSIDGVAVDYDKLFRENLVVSLNPVTGKFLISATLYIVVQFRAATYDLAVAFEI